MNMYGLLLAKKLSGGGGGSATLVSKTITANGTYNPADDNADGYSSVTANVPNTYTVDDNGKVVSNQTLVAQTAKPDTITVNDTYNTTEYNSVTVNVPNTYTAADEGKVVSSGALVSQSSCNIDANGLYDTTLNNSVSVDVPNSYTAGDEGKVVSQGALVSQTAYPSTIVANGTYDTTLYNSVDIDVSSGGTVTEKDVNFYDYDGTLLYSYTAQEFLALSELPANPTHEGLRLRWNWSLANAKTYVTSYGTLTIGTIGYATNYSYAFVTEIVDNDKSWSIYVASPSSVYGTIYWGDGETTSISGVGAYTHNYTNAGKYTIGVSGNAGIYSVSNTSRLCDNSDANWRAKLNRITEVYVGTTYTAPYALRGLFNLQAVLFDNETAHGYAQNLMSSNYVKCVAFANTNRDNSLTGLSDTIEHISFSSGYYGGYYTNLYKLKCVELPTTITSIATSMFDYCATLAKVIIPSSVTSIGGYAFRGCYSLEYIKFGSITPPTVSNANAWNNLPTSCTIYVPRGYLSAYTSASNYPDPNTYTYVEY